MHSIKDLGSNVCFIQPNEHGRIDIETFVNQMEEDVIYVSCMHVNNETGLTNDIKEIENIAEKNEIIFHVDAGSSMWKIPIDVKDMCIDLMSMSAHKVYGPKGVGALYINKDTVGRIKSIILGGGQEECAPGLCLHQIAGMAKAYDLSKREWMMIINTLSNAEIIL